MTPDQVIAVARTWLGTPYHHQGRLKHVGVDCIGLILGVGSECGQHGFDRPEFVAYGRRPPRGKSMLTYFDDLIVARAGEPQPSDILVFWVNKETKRPQHIALYTGSTLIHTFADIGRVVEHGFSPEWREKLVKTYRFPGVE